jgi:glycosyltransferase involved in cell wall biosynthesis
MAAGTPVIATRVGGIPYLLEDEQTALLVDAEDSPAMARAVERLVNEPGLARRLSENGRRLAESCAWETVRKQWDAAFEKVRRQ